MKKFIALASIFIFILIVSCERESQIIKDPIRLTTDQKQLVNSSNIFGFNIFKEVAKNTQGDTNVFISPLSISLALTMLYNGSASITKDELRSGLGYEGLTDEQVNIANRDLIKALIEADPKVNMQIANSIWYKNDMYVKPGFIAINKDYFKAGVFPGKFDTATKDSINNWVSYNTNQKITEILDKIPGGVVMYLINAIYFKGIWKYQFEGKNTTKLDFNVSSEEKVTTDFMTQTGTFEYFQNDLFKAIDLPYGEGNYSMLILLPNENKTCHDILNSLNDTKWKEWNEQLLKHNVNVSIPKFKFGYFKKLNRDLIALGMSSMFLNADLSGISNTDNLAVSRVLHKTFVEVNEEGTEAAAVTAVEIIKTNLPDNLAFNANKPFIFIIKEKDTNTLLFMGILKNPLKN